VNGLHLTADLHGCRCDTAWLTDEDRLLAACVQRVQQHGLQAVAQLGHRFADTPQGPGGVTATVLLAESHLCVHTWPESRRVSLDVYVCNVGTDHSAHAEGLMVALLTLFQPDRAVRRAVQRGTETTT
jgi:S-adenosylmethionine decarboxylase